MLSTMPSVDVGGCGRGGGIGVRSDSRFKFPIETSLSIIIIACSNNFKCRKFKIFLSESKAALLGR